MGKNLGLYLHVPFCRSKCIYCDFYSLPQAEEQIDRYIEALCRHLEAAAARCEGYTVDTVYLGGGTPSYLGRERLETVLDAVHKFYHIAENAEVTLEANPDSTGDKKMIRALREAGVNRVSLGVQSADDRMLRLLGRPHSFAQAEGAVAGLRQGGIENISLDLIYGLPGQTMGHWQETLERTAALSPEHLSCYGLKVEEGTPLASMEAREAIPDGDAQADFYLWTVRRLEELGYGQYELSNFARPGRHSRHNMKYWTLGEYLGLGPGAHSDLGGVRFAWARDLGAYCRGVEAGGLEPETAEAVSRDQRALEYLMLGLRTANGVSAGEFEGAFQRPFAPVEASLTPLIRTGHVLRNGDRWRLSPEGFLVSNQIIGRVLEAAGI